MSPSSPRRHGPQTQPQPFADGGIEQVFRFPMSPPKTPEQLLLLDGTIFRPDDDKSHPVVIINHGMPFDGDFHALERYRFAAASRWFVNHGWAVVVPMRRGYGDSEGECVEGTGGSDNPDFYLAGQSTANDIAAVIAYVRTLAFVDAARVVVLGQSAGAWGTLAVAGRNPPGVIAAIAFAPGRGGDRPGDICKPERLIATAQRFGTTAKIPLLWLSSENDQLFNTALSRDLFQAYSSHGAPAEFVSLSAYGRDGHQVFKEGAGLPVWQPRVESFLRACGAWPDNCTAQDLKQSGKYDEQS